MSEGCGDCRMKAEMLSLAHDTISKIATRAEAAEFQVDKLKKQLRTAQEVIDKHAVDGIEGLHCVDCVAEDDEACDCPMLVPFWEAMKGYAENPKDGLQIGESRGLSYPKPISNDDAEKRNDPIEKCAVCGYSAHSGRCGEQGGSGPEDGFA